MAGKRLEIKVGVFVLFCLIVLAVLVLSFSKGFSLVKTTYDVYLRTTDVGGIKQRAGVLMSGVTVGHVRDLQLAEDGKSVVLMLRIQKQVTVYSDAEFVIEQAGLLGDQYVAIVPKENKPPVLKQGDEVQTAPATDFKQMLRSAAGLIDKLDHAAKTLQIAVGRVDTVLLNETNLGAISRAVSNAETLTVRANGTLEKLDAVVANNAPAIHSAVTNLEAFSRQLTRVGAELNAVVLTNKDEVARALKNVETATATANELLTDLKAGKGLAGGLLRDDSLKREVGVVVDNLAVVSSNFITFTSNLNRYGLFYKPKEPRPAPAPSPYTGRTPFQ